MKRGQFDLTKAGIDLLALSQAGETLKFTRLELGDGMINEGEVFNLNKLKNPRASFPIVSVEATKNNDGTPDGKAMIRADVANGEIEEAFVATEIGIYASDPRYGEILYAVAVNREHPDFIANSSEEIYKMRYNIIVIVGNSMNLQVTVDWNMVCASIQDLKDLENYINKLNVDIRELKLLVLRLDNSNIGGDGTNIFEVDMKDLTVDEQWGYIWDKPNGRLVF